MTTAINYTGRLARLMRDIVARVPALAHVDLGRVLVFARPGRSEARGPHATCHCLVLPASDPGCFYWRDSATGRLTRRSLWFVERSPAVTRGGCPVDYLISFALPRFCDQSLDRSRKRQWYPDAEPWVAKLDTVVHELYHIDPGGRGLRALLRDDGRPSARLHTPAFYQVVAALVREYLASGPAEAMIGFLRHDFRELTARYGGVAGLTFRRFPAYPRRYREALVPQPAAPRLEGAAEAPVTLCLDVDPIKSATEKDLELRQFFAHGSRRLTGGVLQEA